ncbi:hypothetical protein HOLleu_37546 [Holothuria leucospilota]|uniref:Uncharacterized protein n=1 Tax=Holothuria leucospilota TaxID=206669 RepID=A0A9Q1BEU2_HOLLE|nr:hypothetical protein HOLleu_37546 [Holothuria leucospilota]
MMFQNVILHIKDFEREKPANALNASMNMAVWQQFYPRSNINKTCVRTYVPYR